MALELPLEVVLDELEDDSLGSLPPCMVVMMVARNLALPTLAWKGLYQ